MSLEEIKVEMETAAKIYQSVVRKTNLLRASLEIALEGQQETAGRIQLYGQQMDKIRVLFEKLEESE